MNNKIGFTLLGAALAVSGTIFAATSIPFQFTAGQTARAEDVNANFNALVTGINGVDSRVTSLEQASVPATGLKVIRAINSTVISGPPFARQAVCPVDSKVIGGGCSISASPGSPIPINPSARLTNSYPDSSMSWRCEYSINDNSTGTLVVQPYALCMQTTPTSILSSEDSQ